MYGSIYKNLKKVENFSTFFFIFEYLEKYSFPQRLPPTKRKGRLSSVRWKQNNHPKNRSSFATGRWKLLGPVFIGAVFLKRTEKNNTRSKEGDCGKTKQGIFLIFSLLDSLINSLHTHTQNRWIHENSDEHRDDDRYLFYFII